MDKDILHKTLLSKNVSVADYLQMEKEKNQPKIIEFIKLRFTERYITPLRCDPKLKHGFCTMAICCLMIETLESFWQGWDNSRSRSELAFRSLLEIKILVSFKAMKKAFTKMYAVEYYTKRKL